MDASPDMLQLARRNADEAGAGNVAFLHGSIEDIPLPADSVDVVISNCVVNLSPDKAAVFAEVVRVLRKGGRVGISDVVADNGSAPAERMQAAQRVGCLAGVLMIGDYKRMLAEAGLVDVFIERTANHGDGVHSALIKATKPTTAE